MASKYELITAMYKEVCKEVARDKESWKEFLATAGSNYKLRFDEQLLIYAQRPDATAVLEIEKWNNSFHRWVNKGAKGIDGYENVKLHDSFFDIAVGNVPFGDFKVSDKRYDKNKWLIHDYFFGKTLDKVRPGGVIAFITSKGTMDKASPAVRKYIAQRADLIGAIRLPNNTFTKNAGTKVTSDILFLQKRDRITDIEPDWIYLDSEVLSC